MSVKKSEKIMEFTSKKGNPFTFQKVGAAQWLDIADDAEVNGVPRRAKLYPAVLENIVVKPSQMKPDNFDEDPYDGTAELEEVVKAALRFQQGK